MNEEIVKLLQEMRDLQREHLAEYKRAAKQSLGLQQQAVKRQRAALYVAILMIAAGISMLAYVLLR